MCSRLLALSLILAALAGCCIAPASRPTCEPCPVPTFCPVVESGAGWHSTDCQVHDEIQHEIIGTDGSRRMLPDSVYRSWMFEAKPLPGE